MKTLMIILLLGAPRVTPSPHAVRPLPPRRPVLARDAYVADVRPSEQDAALAAWMAKMEARVARLERATPAVRVQRTR